MALRLKVESCRKALAALQPLRSLSKFLSTKRNQDAQESGNNGLGGELKRRRPFSKRASMSAFRSPQPQRGNPTTQLLIFSIRLPNLRKRWIRSPARSLLVLQASGPWHVGESTWQVPVARYTPIFSSAKVRQR